MGRQSDAIFNALYGAPPARIDPAKDNNSLTLNNDPYKQISNYQTRLTSAELPVPERKKTGLKNALFTALDIIDRPGNATRMVVNDATNGGGFDWKRDLKQGITGKEHVYGQDILGNFGVTNRKAKGIGGFALDVLLDPTNLLTGGALGAVKGGLTKGIATTAGRRAITEELVHTGLMGVSKREGETAAGKALQEAALNMGATVDEGGRLVKNLDNPISARIMEEGWKGLNPDTLQTRRGLLQQDIGHLTTSVQNASTEFGKATSRVLPGVASYIRKSDAIRTEDDVTRLIFDVHSAATGKLTSLDKAAGKTAVQGRLDMADYLFKGTYKSEEEFKSLYDGLSDFNDGQLRVACLFQDVFGKKAMSTKNALTVGGKVAAKLQGMAGADVISGAEGMANKFGTLLINRETKEGMETALQFVNGLERVYNRTSNIYYMKFAGKPFLNLSDTVGAGARVLDRWAATSRLVQGNPVGRNLYNFRDALGYLFNTSHVTAKALANTTKVKVGVKETGEDATKTIGELRYSGAKSYTQRMQDYTRQETALAQRARQVAESAFGGILNNPKMRRAVIVAIEGMDLMDDVGAVSHGLDKDAIRYWEKEAKNLSSEELEQVKHYVALHEMLSNALYDSDIAEIEKRLTMFDKPSQKIGEDMEGMNKLKYAPRDRYVHHVYKDADNFNVESLLNPQGERQQLVKQLNPRKDFMEQRKYKSLAQAAEHGDKYEPVFDIVTSFASRVYESQKAAIQNEFMIDLKYMIDHPDQFEGIEHVLSATPKNKTGEDLVQLPDAWSKFYGTPEIKQQMMRLIHPGSANAGGAYMLQAFDHFTNALKTLQTSLNPAFLLRNIVGETLMNWFANVGVKYHGVATDILRDQQRGAVMKVGDSYFFNGVPLIRKRTDEAGNTITEIGKAYRNNKLVPTDIAALQRGLKDDYSWAHMESNASHSYDEHLRDVFNSLGLKSYKINGKDYLAHEIMDKFYEHGLGWSGMTKGNLVENMQDLVRTKTIGGMALKTKIPNPLEAMKSTGDFTETWTRLSHYLDRLDDKGMDWRSAAEDVRGYHVDYRDLTTTEKNVFRRIAPYYTYMRKNTPIQVRQLLMNPGKFSMINHLIQNSYMSLWNDPDAANNQVTVPDYLKQNLAIPYDIDNNGNIRYINWNLPINDVARLQGTLEGFWQTNVASMLHPVIKAAIELPMNKSMQTDSDIQKYAGETAPLMSGWMEAPSEGAESPLVGQGGIRVPKYVDYGLNQLGIMAQARKSANAILAERAGQTDPGKPFVGYPVALTATQSLFPLVNGQQASNTNAYQYRDELQDYVKMLQTEQGITVPPLPPPTYEERIAQHYANVAKSYTPEALYKRYTPSARVKIKYPKSY